MLVASVKFEGSGVVRRCVPLPVGTEMCVSRVVNCSSLVIHWKNFAVLGNMNSLVLTYTPGVNVFPAHSGFTPGWVYVHVGGGTHTVVVAMYCFSLCVADSFTVLQVFMLRRLLHY